MEERVRFGERYEVLGKLGEGSQAEVYVCRDLHLERKVAVKVSREKYRGSLRQEAALMQEIKLSAVPALYDFCEGEYLVMEYIEGMTLREYVDRNGALEEKETEKMARTLLQCLLQIHERTPPVLYCDLKPENLMRDLEGNWHLIDWGAAASCGYEGKEICRVGGTPGYAPPELWKAEGGKLGPQTDIYAFGRVLYYAVSGADPAQPPYASLSVRCYCPLISEKLERVICECTAENPQERCQTVREVSDMLLCGGDHRKSRKRNKKQEGFIRKIEKSIWLAEEKGECTFYKDSCII